MHRSTLSADTVVYRDSRPPAPASTEAAGTLERIRARGSLRIGYDPQNLPMSFFNADGELVGFEVELAEQMAVALRLQPEFVPVSWPEVPELLASGVIDVMHRMAIDRAAKRRLQEKLAEARPDPNDDPERALTPSDVQAAIAAQREFLASDEIAHLLADFDVKYVGFELQES